MDSDNPLVAGVKDCSDSYISVNDVKKCHKSKVFRGLFTATSDLIDNLAGVKIKMLSCVMNTYVLPDSIQCYKCWGFNHLAEKCESPSVCGKCASTEHSMTVPKTVLPLNTNVLTVCAVVSKILVTQHILINVLVLNNLHLFLIFM